MGIALQATRPSTLSRLRARIEPERFTKRGIVRIQMWGFVAAIFVAYPAYVVASDGWSEAFQQPGVLGSAFGAACAAFVAVKTAFSFLENSAKRAEARAVASVPPHDHADLRAGFVSLEERVSRQEATATATWAAVTQIHGAMGDIRADQAAGQRNVRSDIARLEATVKANTDVMASIAAALAANVAAKTKES
jgi:hypothetical protein